jgi:hypothetical protein
VTNRHRAAVLFPTLIICLALAVQASGVVKQYPITFGPTDEWTFNKNLSGPFSPAQGLGVYDTDVRVIDAASVLLVNGVPFAPPAGLDVTDAKHASNVDTIGDVRVKVAVRDYQIDGNDTLRFIYTIKNLGTQSESVDLEWGARRSNGPHVQIFDTTDHDIAKTFGTNEAWMVTTDDQAPSPEGITFALGTRGATSTDTTTTQGDCVRTFNTRIRAKRSKTFVFFVAMDPFPESAATLAKKFNTKTSLVRAGYLGSSTPTANW